MTLLHLIGTPCKCHNLNCPFFLDTCLLPQSIPLLSWCRNSDTCFALIAFGLDKCNSLSALASWRITCGASRAGAQHPCRKALSTNTNQAPSHLNTPTITPFSPPLNLPRPRCSPDANLLSFSGQAADLSLQGLLFIAASSPPNTSATAPSVGVLTSSQIRRRNSSKTSRSRLPLHGN